MEMIFEIRPRTKATIIGMLVLIILAILVGVHKGLEYNVIFLALFMIFLFILDLIQTSNVIEFYDDRIRIRNLITNKSKIFIYTSIAKIEFITSKNVPFIKVKFKDGKTKKTHSNCGFGNMQDAEKKFRSYFPHLS